MDGHLLSTIQRKVSVKDLSGCLKKPKRVIWSFNSKKSRHLTSKDMSSGSNQRLSSTSKDVSAAHILNQLEDHPKTTDFTVPSPTGGGQQPRDWMGHGSSVRSLKRANAQIWRPFELSLMLEQPCNKYQENTSEVTVDITEAFNSISSSTLPRETGLWMSQSLWDQQESERVAKCLKTIQEPTGSPRIQDNNSSGVDTKDSQQLSSTTTMDGFPTTTYSGLWTDIPSNWILSTDQYNALQRRFTSPPTNTQENGIIGVDWEYQNGIQLSPTEKHATLLKEELDESLLFPFL